MSRSSALTLALLAVLALPGRAEEPAGAAEPAPPPARPQWGRGPLEVRDPFVLSLNRLSPWARSPGILPDRGVEVGLRGVWANSYGFQRDRFVIDAEVRQLWSYARLGLWDRFEVSLYLPYEWRGGGVLDGFIENFHSAFGLPDMSRDERPRDRFLVTGIEQDGSVFNYDHQGYGFSDLIVEQRSLILAGDDRAPAVSTTLRVRLPTGRAKFDLSDGVDVSYAIDASKRLGDSPVIVYSTLAYTYYAHARVDDLELTRHRLFFSAGVEWEILPTLSFVTHAWVESHRERALFDDPPRGGGARANLAYGNYVTYVAVGFKAEPVPGLLIDVGMLENIVDPETTSDFGLLANVAYRF